MNPGLRAAISKKLHCERGWEEPLVKIEKYLCKAGDREVKARVSLRGLEEMEPICHLTLSLTANF